MVISVFILHNSHFWPHVVLVWCIIFYEVSSASCISSGSHKTRIRPWVGLRRRSPCGGEEIRKILGSQREDRFKEGVAGGVECSGTWETLLSKISHLLIKRLSGLKNCFIMGKPGSLDVSHLPQNHQGIGLPDLANRNIGRPVNLNFR